MDPLDPSLGTSPDPFDPVSAYLESTTYGFQNPSNFYSILPPKTEPCLAEEAASLDQDADGSTFIMVDNSAAHVVSKPNSDPIATNSLWYEDASAGVVLTDSQCLGPVLNCPVDISFGKTDDVWLQMAELQTEDTSARDGERTFYTQFTAATTYLGRGMFDVGMSSGNLPTQKWGSLLRTGSAYVSQGIDLDADYDQYQSLIQQCDVMSSEECEAQKEYVIVDGVMTASSAANGTFNLASDFLLASSPTASNQISFVALPFYVTSLAAGVYSSVQVLVTEFAKDKKDRDDIKINRAFATLSGTASALASTLYRFGLVGFDMTGANLLTPQQRADLIRGRLMGEVQKNMDYGNYKLVGRSLGVLSALIVLGLACKNYVPAMQKAYEQGDDVRFGYEMLGFTATLSKGFASSALNVPGLVPYACGLYILGCAISVYQIIYLENGGEDKYSLAYSRSSMLVSPMSQILEARRKECGLEGLPLEGETTPIDAWRELLIVAGIDQGAHDSSILDRPSMEVPTRAGNVYQKAQALRSEDIASSLEKRNLLYQIVSEANLSASYPIMPEHKMTTEETIAYAYSQQYAMSGAAYMRRDIELHAAFVENNSLAQAAYLVFLEQSGILTEEYWGTELWENSPALRIIRARLQQSDAKFLRENVFYYNAKTTPLVLVYLRGRSPEDKTLWQEHPQQMQELLSSMNGELGLTGIGEHLDKMQKQIEYYSNASQPENTPELSEEEIDRLLIKLYDDSQSLSASIGFNPNSYPN